MNIIVICLLFSIIALITYEIILYKGVYKQIPSFQTQLITDMNTPSLDIQEPTLHIQQEHDILPLSNILSTTPTYPSTSIHSTSNQTNISNFSCSYHQYTKYDNYGVYCEDKYIKYGNTEPELCTFPNSNRPDTPPTLPTTNTENCFASSVTQENWNCDRANTIQLAGSYSGEDGTPGITGDECARLAYANAECSDLINYYPQGTTYAGECKCVKKDESCDYPHGWRQQGGQVASVLCPPTPPPPPLVPELIINECTPLLYVPHIYMLNSYPILKLWTHNTTRKKNLASFVYDRTRSSDLFTQLGVDQDTHNLPTFKGEACATFFDDEYIFIKKFIISENGNMYTLRTICDHLCGQFEFREPSSSMICDEDNHCNLPGVNENNKYRPQTSGLLFKNMNIVKNDISDFEIDTDETIYVYADNKISTQNRESEEIDNCLCFKICNEYLFILTTQTVIQMNKNTFNTTTYSISDSSQVLPPYCPTSGDTTDKNHMEQYVDCQTISNTATYIQCGFYEDIYYLFVSYENGLLRSYTIQTNISTPSIVLHPSPTLNDTDPSPNKNVNQIRAPLGGISSFQIVPDQKDYSKYTIYVMQRKYIKESLNVIKTVYVPREERQQLQENFSWWDDIGDFFEDVGDDIVNFYKGKPVKRRGGTIEDNGGGDLYIYNHTSNQTKWVGFLYHWDLGGMMNTNALEDLHIDTFTNHSLSFQVMPHMIKDTDMIKVQSNSLDVCYYNVYTDEIDIEPTFNIQEDTNYPGQDSILSNSFRFQDITDVKGCVDKCIDNPYCDRITVVSSGDYVGCWLKSQPDDGTAYKYTGDDTIGIMKSVNVRKDDQGNEITKIGYIDNNKCILSFNDSLNELKHQDMSMNMLTTSQYKTLHHSDVNTNYPCNLTSPAYVLPYQNTNGVVNEELALYNNINKFIDTYPVDGSLGFGTGYPYKSKFVIQENQQFKDVIKEFGEREAEDNDIWNEDKRPVLFKQNIKDSNTGEIRYMCSNIATDVYINSTNTYPNNLQDTDTHKFCNIHPNFQSSTDNVLATYKQMGDTYINHFDNFEYQGNEGIWKEFMNSNVSEPDHMMYGLETCVYSHNNNGFFATNNWGSYCRTGYNQKIGCDPTKTITEDTGAYSCNTENSNVISKSLNSYLMSSLDYGCTIYDEDCTNAYTPDENILWKNANKSCPTIHSLSELSILNNYTNEIETLYEDNNKGSWFNKECPSTHPYKRALNNRDRGHKGLTRIDDNTIQYGCFKDNAYTDKILKPEIHLPDEIDIHKDTELVEYNTQYTNDTKLTLIKSPPSEITKWGVSFASGLAALRTYDWDDSGEHTKVPDTIFIDPNNINGGIRFSYFETIGDSLQGSISAEERTEQATNSCRILCEYNEDCVAFTVCDEEACNEDNKVFHMDIESMYYYPPDDPPPGQR